MVSWGSVDNRSSVDNRCMVSWSSSLDNWGMVSWGSVDNRGMVGWSRGSMINRGRGMVSRGSVDNWGMVSWSRGGMIDRGRGIALCDGESSRCNSSSRSLLIASIAMYRLRSSVGLAHNRGMYSSMGLVDRVAHSRGIALLDALGVGLVSGNYGQKSGTDKSLHVCSSIAYDQKK